MKTVAIIPVGDVNRESLPELARAIGNTFSFKTKISEAVRIPERAYNPKRRQYHSTIIIEELSRLKREADLILGITDVDLYVPQLNFVFGEADILRGIAIISLTRLREEFYRARPDQKLFVDRAIKEAIHEIGHLCGLDHCHDRRCIMYFSNSIRDTDIKGPGFCKSCRVRLGF
ncbi:MAG: archaemetzincin family Zn-dependent metalloprotease [Thermodesulfovibrionales bacterium]